jgi:hypothetical protein
LLKLDSSLINVTSNDLLSTVLWISLFIWFILSHLDIISSLTLLKLIFSLIKLTSSFIFVCSSFVFCIWFNLLISFNKIFIL